MPTETIIVLSLVITAFTVFALTVAYGEYQTRHFKRPDETVSPDHPAEGDWRQAA
jgi:hypothetical protein